MRDPQTIAQLAAEMRGDRRAAQRWLLTTPDERLSPELLAEKRRLQAEQRERAVHRRAPWSQQPKRRAWSCGCLALVAILVFAFFAIIAIGGSHSTRSTSVTPANDAQWTVTNTFSGNGASQTSTFTVGSDWKIDWSCVPASFGQNQYNVIVEIDSPGQNLPVAVAINALCSPNVYGGTTEEYQAGTFYLAVNSEADWSIKIEQLI